MQMNLESTRSKVDSFFSPTIYGIIIGGVCVFIGMGILYCIWRGHRGRVPLPPPMVQVQLELPPRQDEVVAAAAAAAIAKVQCSAFTLEEGGHDMEMECSLCLVQYEEGEDLAVIKCGHNYHRACLINGFVAKKTVLSAEEACKYRANSTTRLA